MTIHHRSYRGQAGVGAIAAVAAFGLLLLFGSGPARAAESPVNLNTAAGFSVLAGTTVTNTGATTLAQGLGVHPGSAATGFPPGVVAGETHLADGVALQAESDLTAAYADAAGRTPFTSLASELGGRTLIPGVYRLGAAQLTGQLTLDSQNDPAAVFIFQISSSLITASNSELIFINGASPCNVFWQVTSSATLGTNSDFSGNIMALTSITMNTGATLAGRALARNGAVTLDTNDITTPICAAATSPPTTSAPATSVPATSAPASGAPTASAPATSAPTASAPATSVPATSVPATSAPANPPGAPPALPPGVPPALPPGVPPAQQPGPPPVNPPIATPPSDATIIGPPRLPTTGPGRVPVLLATGIVLIALGGGIVLRYRRGRIC